jgi:hypothetical protein
MKTSFGESVEQLMRLASRAAGDMDGWEDTSAQVMWRDTESRSLAQVADALGKMAQMLSIPPRALWERIPGVTEQDLERWEAMADKEDGMAANMPPGSAAPTPEQLMAQGGADVVPTGPAGPAGQRRPARAARTAGP